MNDLVRKCCLRCGWKGDATRRQRHCHQPRFGIGSYACWGDLVVVVRRRCDPLVAQTPDGVGIGWQLSQEADVERAKLARADAERKLAVARKKVAEKTRQMARMATSIRLWERRAAYYAQRASMTDAEFEAERLKRQQRRDSRPVRRGIALEGRDKK